MKQISEVYQKVLDNLEDSEINLKLKIQKPKKVSKNPKDLINLFMPSKALKIQGGKAKKLKYIKKKSLKQIEFATQDSLSDVFLTLTNRLKDKENQILHKSISI